MEHQSSFLRALEMDDLHQDLQSKISSFFEKSIMETCLLNYETLNNDLDNIRQELFIIKENIIEIDNKLNPKALTKVAKPPNPSFGFNKNTLNGNANNKLISTSENTKFKRLSLNMNHKANAHNSKASNNVVATKTKALSTNFNSNISNKSVISNVSKFKAPRISTDFGTKNKSVIVK